MKTSKNIISHIVSLNKFQNIKTVQNLERIKSILPPHLQKINIINFMYIRGNILFIALNHQGFKMEIDMKMRTLKPIILNMKNMLQNFPRIDDVKTFVTNRPLISGTIDSNNDLSDISFDEKSTGDFFIDTQSEDLKNIFKSIIALIKNTND